MEKPNKLFVRFSQTILAISESVHTTHYTHVTRLHTCRGAYSDLVLAGIGAKCLLDIKRKC